MSGCFKPYLFLLVAVLLAAVLLNAPVAFASKLPTACNIFNKTQLEKSGPCGPQALFSNDKFFGNEVLFTSEINFSFNESHLFQSVFFSLSAPSVTFSSAVPLRC
jgi:hypothetical protein